MQFVVVVLGFLVGLTTAHVRLTFPPARKFDFDFLDNVRTNGPCGMEPSDGTELTRLTKGSTINVTWHLAYSHRGGFKLELVQNTSVVANLTGGEYVDDDDITATSYEVTLPADFEGEASLRLIRHAREWSTTSGADYIFWSCADVNVTSAGDCNGACNEQNCVDGKCTSCPHLSFGDYCQYQDDCANYEDCSMHGECWRVSATTYPRHQCFCEEGYFGKKCEKENPQDFDLDIDKSKYFERSPTDGFKIYYMIREANQEIEIAVEAESTTWVALGFKPTGLTSACKNYPVQYRTGVPIGEPESESDVTTTEEPQTSGRRRRRSADLRQDIQTEDDNPYQSDWECDPDEWHGPEGQPEGEPEPEGKSNIGKKLSKILMDDNEADGEPEPEGAGEPEPEGTGEPEPEGTGEPEPEGTGEPEPEGTGEPEGEPEGGATTNIHAMDCMDVIIGSAKGRLGNIGDYYTRDRSTPRRDEDFYGGTNDLTAGGAKQVDGVTTIVFRRKLTTSDLADHDIAYREGMNVIWARGQEIGREIHRPASGLENCEAKMQADYLFYRKDEIKYHGTHENQRGVIPRLDFYADPNVPQSGNCRGKLTEPNDCVGTDCTYRLDWTYFEDEDEVQFDILAKTDMNRWTGVGFSPDGGMDGSDAVLAWHDGTSGSVKDYYLGGKSQSLVTEDEQSNIKDPRVSYIDGQLRVSFKRKRNTGDQEKDIILDDKQCIYMLQPIVGGTFSNGVARHAETPVSTMICIGKCEEVAEGDCPEYAGCDANGLLSSFLLVAVVMLMKKALLE